MLGVVAEASCFYLDSRTSADSRGYAVALELGIPPPASGLPRRRPT
jgi:polysaccharide deacetylase 2 family uncharacterized protein YibQ